MLLTTHQLDEAERLCDRFGLLHRGRLVSCGSLGELQAATGCKTLVEMFLKLTCMEPALKTSSPEPPIVEEGIRR